MPQALAAFGLTVALVAVWTVVGLAVATALDPERARLQNLLLAPVYGIAIVVLAEFVATRAAQPMPSVGPLIGVVLLLGAAVMLWRTSGWRVPRTYAAFVALFVGAMLLTGWPIFEKGFGWLALANDDMANYVLGADLLLHHGFAAAPDYTQLAAGKDYTQFYWYALIPGGARPGSELLLGWVVSTTGLSGHEAFMPVMLALQITLVSAAAALAYQSRQVAMAAWVTGALVAASALTNLGTLYQLIAQVDGLGLLVASAILLLGTSYVARRAALRLGALIGLVVAALLVVYPELFPFLTLAFLGHRGIQLMRRQLRLPTLQWLALSIGAGAVTSLVLLNTFVPRVVDFLLFQVTSGLQPSQIQSSIFPYFLLPSGLADLWGLQSVGDSVAEPWMSLTIAVGAILLVGAAAISVLLMWRGHVAASVVTPMLVFAARLMMQQSGFGLFKLAMYAQPFLLGTIVVAWFGSRSSGWRLVPLVALGAAGMIGQTLYVQRSTTPYGTVPTGSPWGVVQEFRKALASAPDGPLTLDTPDIVLAKIQSLYTKGREVNLPNREFFSNIVPESIWLRDPLFKNNVENQFVTAQFAMLDPTDTTRTNQFIVNTLGESGHGGSACNVLVSTTANQTVFNRLNRPSTSGEFAATRCSDITNHLLFVHSALGLNYYWVGSKHFDEPAANISMYQVESDPLRSGGSMAGVGRNLLFEVLNPSGPVRLVLDITDTLKGDGANLLPPAAAIGTTREALSLVGHGSARVVSPPLQPQHIDGRDYVALDMGVDGISFRGRREGLMGLYGGDIPLDRRQLVAFARDVSAISEADYARMRPPARVDDFAHQLADPNVEYSGIYEDGWVGDNAYVRLDTGTNAASRIAVDGLVPDMQDPAFAPELQLLVNGAEVARQQLQPGNFTLVSPALEVSGPSRVELRFSQVRNLPDPDNRPIAAHLSSIRFVPAAATQASDIIEARTGLSLGSGWYPLETFAGERFRWVANDAEIVVAPADGNEQSLKLQVEPGPGVGSQPFTLEVLDKQNRVVATALVEGRQAVDVPLPVTAGQTGTFRLHVDGGGAPTPGDPRTLNFRVFSFAWAS